MRISLVAWIFLAYAALTGPLNGQTSFEPANAATVTIIRAARFLDVTDGKIVPNVSVAVKDGKILSVSAGLTIPGATVIDLGDMTILPGLIDVHTHLTFDAQTDWVHLPVEETAVDAALRVSGRHGLRYWQALRQCAISVTGLRDSLMFR